MIPEHKSRYSFTLTTANVEKFRELCKKCNIPNTHLSSAIDDFIKQMNVTIEKCVNKGSASITDLFTMMGEQLELLQEEEKHDAEKRKKKKTP